MNQFRITGGCPIGGTIIPQGAKNEALQIICATLLTKSAVTIHNIPDISDIRDLIVLLNLLGVCTTQPQPGTYIFQAAQLNTEVIHTAPFQEQFSKIRGSIMLVGPLLARFGQLVFPSPGGDRIGRRRLNVHLVALHQLGARFIYNQQDSTYIATASSLQGCYILLEEASVTGTANVVMAASLARGTTTIYNAACELHVQQLCHMLVNMGITMTGIGSNLLTIHGCDELGGVVHTIMPDIIEVGSFIGLAAATMSDITIENIPTQLFTPVFSGFKKLGIALEVEPSSIRIPAQYDYHIQNDKNGTLITLADGIWPSFPSDLISIAIVTAIYAKGTLLIHQKMFESRLFFVDQLIEMGARLVLCDPHRVSITGLNRTYPLKGIKMISGDIRAGIALLIAALAAEGVSTIENIQQIDRGYERIDERLNGLGASIARIPK